MFGVGLLVVVRVQLGGVVGLLVALWLVLATIGFVGANPAALALSRHGDRAGTAAATIGFLQAGIGGAVSPLVGVLGGDGVAMALVVTGSMLVAVLVLALGTPAYRRDGWLLLDGEHEDARPTPAPH